MAVVDPSLTEAPPGPGQSESAAPTASTSAEEALPVQTTEPLGVPSAPADGAGGRAHEPSVGGRRHGSNPGTVGLAGQRVPIRVPRIRHVAGSEMPLRSYEALHGSAR